MDVFNIKTRTNNVVKTSLISALCNIINTILGFVYRTVFLHILSASYLGINGLFTNILQILSLAELGITTAITYRFYKPIKGNDVEKVGQLMNFFKVVYRIIAITIIALGMMLYPFLDYLINDVSEVPSDINLHLVYVLYLLLTVSTYLHAYRQVILSADQKQYVLSVCNTLMAFGKYLVQTLVLVILKSFTLSLASGIVVNLLTNYVVSMVVARKYKPVFQVKTKLSKEEKKQILYDTKATVCHKIGGTVLTGTDNIVLTKFVSLVATGYYANYTLITNGLINILTQLLGSFTSSFGSAHVSLDEEKNKAIFERMFFVNSFIAGAASVLLFELANSFITLWVGAGMVLEKATVIAICIQFYLEADRQVAKSFTNGCGLFVKDQIRPIIQAVINIVVSILLVLRIGLPGVFIGTIISHLVTVFWREPYILYKYEFDMSSISYWKMFFKYTSISLFIVAVCECLKAGITFVHKSFISWLIEAIIVLVLYSGFFLLVNWKDKHCVFFRAFAADRIKKVMKKV